LEASNASAATLGSVPYLASVCGKDGKHGPLEAAHRIVYRSPSAECRFHKKFGEMRADTCLGFLGRRKPMALLGGDLLVGIHAMELAPGGRIANLNASHVWIRHARGVAFADGDHGVKAICAGDSACARLPGELPDGEPKSFNCSTDLLGGPLFAHESTVGGGAAGDDAIAGVIASYGGLVAQVA